MKDQLLEADYVIVGAGAVGLSFADVILTESDADVVIVDRRARPGGHWNDAYPFVRLHQPSSFYGVNSKSLGRGRKDDHGPNAGLFELATRDELCNYYEQLMHDQFLPSGRVRYLPMSEYAGGQVTSLLTGEATSLRARRKMVDARYVGSEVPSTTAPAYHAAPGIELIPVNGLAEIKSSHPRYVIIGAGKTGVDACLWLLGHGVEPPAIVWVRARDAWFFDRANFQGGEEFFERTMGAFATLFEVAGQADSVEDLFVGLEEAGVLMRIDPARWPTMFRSATMTRAERDLLDEVTNVVQLGRVLRIDRDALVLEDGSVPIEENWLFVDCTAAGIPVRPPVPVFGEGRITLQYLMFGGFPPYGAALTAYVELTHEDDELKNALCRPLPITGELADVPRNLLGDLEVRQRWLASPVIREWMARSRLDLVMHTASRIGPADEAKQAVVMRYLAAVEPARVRLSELTAATSPPHPSGGRNAVSRR
jgi:hypothetical protein